ncbi:MAG: hypothetical protein ACRDTJ_04375 [Pseudonocardiaceae bacterium]
MRISVRRSGNAISTTARDLQAAAVSIPLDGNAIVHSNGETANRLARAIAQSKAGPHGENYYKRISAEMTGQLSVEVGPSDLLGVRYTGVGGSAGAGRDLDEALEAVAPEFHKDAADMMDDLL